MNQLDIKAEAHVTADAVHVKYFVRNQRTVPIFLFDFAFGAKAALRTDFGSVGFAPPETVVFASTLSEPPPGTSWAAPPVVYARRLGPGDTLTQERIQPLPLRTTDDPFALASPPTGPLPPARSVAQSRCTTLRLVLGFASERDELGAKPAPSFGDDIYALRPTALDHQQLISFDIANVDLTLEHP